MAPGRRAANMARSSQAAALLVIIAAPGALSMSWNARIEQRSTSAALFPCTAVGHLRGGRKGQEDDNGHEISCADSAAQLILAKSEVWGDERRGKRQLLQWYPFTDHRQILALKPKGQKGPAKERQTFLLCYPYAEGIDAMHSNDNGTEEAKLIDQLSMMGMKYHKVQSTKALTGS